MKNLINLLVAVMLIFAVSCNNDNPNNLSDAEKSKIIDGFLEVMGEVYEQEISSLEKEIDAEIYKAFSEGKSNGSVTKSNDDGTIMLVADYYSEEGISEPNASLTLRLNGYVHEKYTVWGIDGEYSEYIFIDNLTRDVTMLKIVELDSENEVYEYYLNGERVEYISQQIRWS